MKFLIAILIFCAIIIVHEFGHFLFAKLNHVTVNEFAIGMGPKLFEWGKGETKYTIRLFPIGGACMMLGEDEDMEDAHAFNNAGVLGRISIVFGGPLFNFLMAFVFALIVTIFAGANKPYITQIYDNSPAAQADLPQGALITKYNGYSVSLGNDVYNATTFKPLTKDGVKITYKYEGKEYTKTMKPQYYITDVTGLNIAINTKDGGYSIEVTDVKEGSGADKAGIKKGDIITTINGEKISKENDIYANIFCDGKSDIAIDVDREGKSLSFLITPDTDGSALRCGFAANLAYEKLSNPFQVVKYSVINVKYWIVTTVRSLGMIVKGDVTLNDLSGPVGIVKMISDDYTSSVENGENVKEKVYNVVMTMSMMTILLSANIGVMNLIPLPALDGGRLFFLLIELITRKKVNQKIEGMVHFIGLMLLMLLMFVIMGNDIIKLVR